METFLTLSVLVAACVLPVCIVGWIMLSMARRMADHNKDLLKAVLALSSGSAAPLAAKMEMGDQLGRQPPAPPALRQVGS